MAHASPLGTKSVINDNATWHHLYIVSEIHVTTYYSTQDAYPPSPLHFPTQSSRSLVHVISTLTCNISALAKQQTQSSPQPIYNCWYQKQWLTSSPTDSNNSNNPPIFVNMNEQAQSLTSLAQEPLWLPSPLLLCFMILMATLLPRGWGWNGIANNYHGQHNDKGKHMAIHLWLWQG
jgi:hypothetical protein